MYDGPIRLTPLRRIVPFTFPLCPVVEGDLKKTDQGCDCEHDTTKNSIIFESKPVSLLLGRRIKKMIKIGNEKRPNKKLNQIRKGVGEKRGSVGSIGNEGWN